MCHTGRSIAALAIAAFVVAGCAAEGASSSESSLPPDTSTWTLPPPPSTTTLVPTTVGWEVGNCVDGLTSVVPVECRYLTQGRIVAEVRYPEECPEETDSYVDVRLRT